ncbi:hypothetical protein [uncultured Dysosmobacter sp.]|uniref:hypothetical protein n=1 Tax=uncultured Dysosmobacter sp. TaxID=2591384 RepID=UPI002626E6F4|nr:hypothetical protein [uncultured Dysosmobacter sp.]
MNFFRKVGNAIVRFMYGRNGMDQMNVMLLRGYLALFVAQLVCSFAKLYVPTLVCEILMWPLMFLILFRMFSKNLYKRREENSKFMQRIWRMKNRRTGARERHADKEHKYFTCKNCKTICRVPVGKGKIIITCPKCGAQIHAKT